MRPICVPCRRFFRPKKNGFYFLEGMPSSNDVPPGNAMPEGWRPYKLWAGDLYECPGCGAQTIVGVPQRHLAEHYEPGFKAQVERLRAEFQVNDC